MTRLEAITRHLLSKGAQHPQELITDKFTELTFRKLIPSVRVRVYQGGIIEILFGEEMCGGSNRDNFSRMPDMDWVLQTIDDYVKPQPNEKSHEA